jgi:hypothetical protein
MTAEGWKAADSRLTWIKKTKAVEPGMTIDSAKKIAIHQMPRVKTQRIPQGSASQPKNDCDAEAI